MLLNKSGSANLGPGQGPPSLCQCLVTSNFHVASFSSIFHHFPTFGFFIIFMFCPCLSKYQSDLSFLFHFHFYFFLFHFRPPFYIGIKFFPRWICRGPAGPASVQPCHSDHSLISQATCAGLQCPWDNILQIPPRVVGQWTSEQKRYTNDANHWEKNWNLSQPTFRTGWNLTKIVSVQLDASAWEINTQLPLP